MSIIEIKDNIYVIKNIIETEKCNEIVRFIKDNKSLLEYTEVSTEKKNNVECTFISIDNNKTNKYLLGLDEFIENKIGDIVKLIVKENPMFPNNVFDNGYTLRQIHGGTVLHIDGIFENSKGALLTHPRLLSIIINLNEDYNGGEFNFPKQNIKIRLKMGEAICFPPYWTHPHEVSSIVVGEYRYTINTWILQ